MQFGEQSTALHYAVYIGDKNSVELLLACDKIDVNVTTAGFKVCIKLLFLSKDI